MRHEFTDHEWAAIKPMLPNKPRGVPRVNDRRVLNGIFWVLRPAHRGAICCRRLGLRLRSPGVAAAPPGLR
jgi:transposase